jgi:predicted lipid carrier protein YhbT
MRSVSEVHHASPLAEPVSASPAPASSASSPLLSPALLAGLLLRPVPAPLVQLALDRAMAVMRRRHPAVFDRLADLGETVVCFQPRELPMTLALGLGTGAGRPWLRLAGDAEQDAASATIRGSLPALIDLLEGRVDGDALFFSRALHVEGDTHVVVCLRNAVDGEEIDLLTDFASQFGPLSGLCRRAVGDALRLANRAAADVERARTVLLSPVAERTDALAAEVLRLEAELQRLRLRTAKVASSRGRATAAAALDPGLARHD